ncbi:hypothetical protein MCERH10_01277 [Caulobacteraceae bacterium]
MKRVSLAYDDVDVRTLANDELDLVTGGFAEENSSSTTCYNWTKMPTSKKYPRGGDWDEVRC